jgi:hypothetical protein
VTWIPLTIDAVDAAWLSEALGHEVQLAGEPQPLSSFACQVFRLRLTGPPGSPAGVIVKLGIQGPIRAFIDGLRVYQREVAFYDLVAQRCSLRTPQAYVARLASASTDFVLVLEDLHPLSSGDQLAGLSLHEAELAIDELARFHGWSWGTPMLEELADTFPPIDSPTGLAMQEQWAQFFGLGWPAAIELAGDAMTAELQAFGDHFTDHVSTFIEQLATPRVLTHGELRADNMIFDGDAPPVFIDFQNAQQECGPRELAYFLTQSLTVERRRGQDELLVRRYWEGLLAASVTGYPWEDAWRQYRLAVANQLMMVVVACMRFDAVDARAQALLREMVRRGLAAIEHNGSLALLGELSPQH